MFSGSYQPDDVHFLLKPIDMACIDVLEREKKRQFAGKHYSETIPKEYSPSAQYQAAFYELFALNKRKLAQHILALANKLNERESLVLVSLARAGTPVGVLLKRTLRDLFDRNVPHYSISIILERGIDENALRYILAQHDLQGKSIIFVDGWTGKGSIAHELRKSITLFNQKYHTEIATDLYVVADICGYATVAATTEDYVIPSALLNATVSGLISRTILNQTYISADDFHGCRFYTELQAVDLSLWYVDQMMVEIRLIQQILPCVTIEQASLQAISQAFLKQLRHVYQIKDNKLIKPGIGEAIRVLLRRVPHRILVQREDLSEITPFLILAEEKQVIIEEVNDMPYKATGIISTL